MRRISYLLIDVLILLLGMGIAGGVWAAREDIACVVSIQPFRPGQPEPPISQPRCFPSLEKALQGLHLIPVPTLTPPTSPGDQPLLETPLKSGDHCVVEIEPLRPGEHSSHVQWVGCFESFAEAIGAATDGAIQLPPDWNPADGLPERPVPMQGNSVLDCGGSCSSMGVMDNQTSSERWTP